MLYDQLKNAQNFLEDGFKFLDKIFLNIGNLIVGSNQSLEQTELVLIKKFIHKANTELPVFSDWNRYQECISTLGTMGAEDFISYLKKSDILPELWYPLLKKLVYQK